MHILLLLGSAAHVETLEQNMIGWAAEVRWRQERCKVASATLGKEVCVVCWRRIADWCESAGESPAKIEGDTLEMVGIEAHVVVDYEVMAGPGGAFEGAVRLKEEVVMVGVADGWVICDKSSFEVLVMIDRLREVSPDQQSLQDL